MAYTVGQLVTDVRNKLDDSSFSSTLIKEFLNDAQRYIINKHAFSFLEATISSTLTTGEYVYDMPDGVAQIESMRITLPDGDERDITRNFLTPQEFDNMFPNPTLDDVNVPRYWTVRDDNFVLYPRPDQGYTLDIRYQKEPTTLSADSDVPLIPERYKELLVLGALSRAHKFNDNYDMAQNEQSELEQQLLDLNARSYTRNRGKPTVMRVNGRRA